MAIHNLLCFLFLNQIMMYGVFCKHVHLKILVPDVINRHTHTRTILLHLHMPAPKKPKTHKKHEYHSNWSSWKYGYQQDYKDDHGDLELDHKNHQKDYGETLTVKSKNRKQHRQKHFPVYDYSKDSYLPPSYVEGNDVDQKNRDEDEYNYAVHEDVNDVPPNTDSISYNYEEGYKKGLETETGRIRADQVHKFHEDQREEQGETEHEGFKEDFETKTDAGRYLVDDVEYENTRDKRDQGRRSKRIYKT